MPYIITTLDTARYGEPMEDQTIGDLDGATRTAVATLEEARDWTFNARVNDHGQVEPLPESGGTFGPLPDGTVIEVERVS